MMFQFYKFNHNFSALVLNVNNMLLNALLLQYEVASRPTAGRLVDILSD